MGWIITTGILTCGLLPLLALFGMGVNLIIGLFITVATWTYWQCVGVGLVFCCILGVTPISINIKRKKKDED